MWVWSRRKSCPYLLATHPWGHRSPLWEVCYYAINKCYYHAVKADHYGTKISTVGLKVSEKHSFMGASTTPITDWCGIGTCSGAFSPLMACPAPWSASHCQECPYVQHKTTSLLWPVEHGQTHTQNTCKTTSLCLPYGDIEIINKGNPRWFMATHEQMFIMKNLCTDEADRK